MKCLSGHKYFHFCVFVCFFGSFVSLDDLKRGTGGDVKVIHILNFYSGESLNQIN